MLAAPLVVAAAFAYLLLLFAIAEFADRRSIAGRSLIGNAWVYALSMGVYCTAWTYFGSIGRAATLGLWFLPIYLGPTLAMVPCNLQHSNLQPANLPTCKPANLQLIRTSHARKNPALQPRAA